MEELVRFTLNGKPVTLKMESDRKLLWVLRTELGLTGAKYGCGEGHCGSCTVLVNNEAIRSCRTSLKEVKGKEVVTIEGLAKDGVLHPLQKAFMEHDALQCGYCTPGMILQCLCPAPEKSAAFLRGDRLRPWTTTCAGAGPTTASSRPSRRLRKKCGEEPEMKDHYDDIVQHDAAGTADLMINRREFLELAGSGIFLFFVIGEMPVFAQEGPGRRPPVDLPADFNAFLRIAPDGRVSCYTGKIEMGQGVITSLAQELADELDTPLDTVDMVMGDTDLCPWDRGTFGSLSTRVFGQALRAAGAEARQVLLVLASEQLKTPSGRARHRAGRHHRQKEQAEEDHLRPARPGEEDRTPFDGKGFR